MKPKIFLSHITEEAAVAAAFKEVIDGSFLGMVEVFQSSDQDSLPLGKNWLDGITEALRNCELMLVFCSPYSVDRPWINFESGAGWARDIQVIPICHSGIRPVDLPIPLSLLQGVVGSDAGNLKPVFDIVAQLLESKVPVVDCERLAENVAKFEEMYIESIELTRHVHAIGRTSQDLLDALSRSPAGAVTPIRGTPEKLIERCREPIQALERAGHLSQKFQVEGLSFGGPHGGGNDGMWTVKVDDKLSAKIKEVLEQLKQRSN